ncbi:MAG: murein transglycosylase A [Rhodospirillales bacterium]
MAGTVSRLPSGRLATVLLVALLAACAPRPPAEPELGLRQTLFTDLAGWAEADGRAALAAFARSCVALAKKSPDAEIGPQGLKAAAWQKVCAALPVTNPVTAAEAKGFFERHFQPFAVFDAASPFGGDGLFTGYFEPELRGSRKAHGPYRTPLYQTPAGFVTVDLGLFSADWKGRTLNGRLQGNQLFPLPSRAEIVAGALANQGLELVWVDDPVDAFFLQIQGSGRVALAEGGEMRLGYAAKNGHPYRAVGRDLIAWGEVAKEDMSLQAIRDWMAAHPERQDDLMNRNPSYVFFRELKDAGPLGAQGVALTPEASLAVDPRFIPYGAPLWLETTDPLRPETPLNRLVIAQDTGGAIRGVVRGDLFWGAGDRAARAAGAMKQPGRYTLFLPR